jgi:hypothetical protein
MNVVLGFRPVSVDCILVLHILVDVAAVYLWLNGVPVAGLKLDDYILVIHVLTDVIAVLYARKTIVR